MPSEPSALHLSIGALSKATGIPVPTIRTWERRYGFPEPERDEQGHRQYPMSMVARLRLVHQAIELGHKPGYVMGLAEPQLERLLRETRVPRTPPPPPPVRTVQPMGAAEASPAPTPPANPTTQNPTVGAWVELADEPGDRRLPNAFAHAWDQVGAMQFVTQYAVPFLDRVASQGEGPRRMAQQRLQEFLNQKWRAMSDRAEGPRIVVATLPGESDTLTIHLAAVVLAMSGLRIAFPGARTPGGDVVLSIKVMGAHAVCVTTSDGQGIDALRSLLPARVPLVVVGSGVASGPGVDVVGDLNSLVGWSRGFALQAAR